MLSPITHFHCPLFSHPRPRERMDRQLISIVSPSRSPPPPHFTTDIFKWKVYPSLSSCFTSFTDKLKVAWTNLFPVHFFYLWFILVNSLSVSSLIFQDVIIIINSFLFYPQLFCSVMLKYTLKMHTKCKLYSITLNKVINKQYVQ